MVTWTDSLPANQAGGKAFLMYKTSKGTVAIAEMDDKKEALQRKEGVRVLELERDGSGRL